MGCLHLPTKDFGLAQSLWAQDWSGPKSLVWPKVFGPKIGLAQNLWSSPKFLIWTNLSYEIKTLVQPKDFGSDQS